MNSSHENQTVCFLSMDNLDEFVDDDDLAVAELQKRRCNVVSVDWQSTEIDWNQFDLVVIRSTWNYQKHRGRFLDVLGQIETSKTLLINPLAIVQWNIDKQYLTELSQLGISIVPMEQFEGWAEDKVNAAIDSVISESFVVKPRISANADDTFLISKSDWKTDSKLRTQVGSRFRDRGLILQPYVDSIATQGEFSVFYIDDDFTHAISKKPKPGDFRVQEEHGGIINSIPLDPFYPIASDIMDKLPFQPFYARLDFVSYNEKLCIMEIELIEPSLYFRFGQFAVNKFADMVLKLLASNQ